MYARRSVRWMVFVWRVVMVSLGVWSSALAAEAEGPQTQLLRLEGVDAARVLANFATARPLGNDGTDAADAQAVYPFGTPASTALRHADLVLGADGAAAARVRLGPSVVPEVVLNGRHDVVEGVHLLDLAGSGERGLQVTLDGVLRPSAAGYELTALWTAGVRHFRHAEAVTLRLAPGAQGDGTAWPKPAPLPVGDAADGGSPVMSEPRAWIDGIPVPTQYTIGLDVSLDGGPPLALLGTLLLNSAMDPTAPHRFQVMLLTETPAETGWSAWSNFTNAGSDGPAASDSGMEVSAHDGHIEVRILPREQPVRTASWQADELIMADSGIIRLDVTVDGIRGDISASGRQYDGSAHRLEARFSGHRAGKAAVDAVVQAVGRRRFDGHWSGAEPFGDLTLTQTLGQATVGGEFEGGGTLQGVPIGPWLDVSWHHPEQGAGRGLLAVTGNGLLVGLLWNGELPDTPIPVVATQQVAVLPPADKIEARELKNLGYDLYHAGKYAAATEVLALVVDFFQASDDPVWEYTAVATLLDSASLAGDYPRLVHALAQMADVQARLGQNDRMTAATRQQKQLHAAELASTGKTLGLLAAAFERSRAFVTTGGIGVQIAVAPQGLAIETVTAGMPAATAGVRPGDVITAVDGVSLAGLDSEEAAGRLTGAAGTELAATLLRGDASFDVRLTRAPLLAFDEEQRRGIEHSLADLRDLAARLRADLDDDVRRLQGAGLAGLLQSVQQRRAALRADHAAAVDLGERALAYEARAAGLFRRTVALLGGAMQKEEAVPKVLALDEDIDAYKLAAAGPLDYDLLENAVLLFSNVRSVEIALAGRERNVAFAEKAAKQAPPPADSAEVIARFSAILDHWRGRLVTDAARIDALKYGQAFYTQYIRVLLRLGLPEQALAASEAARARAFADLLTLQDTQAAVPAAAALTVDDIRALVRALNQPVVEYFVLDDEVLVWVLRPDDRADVSIQIRHLPITKTRLDEQVNALFDLLEPNDRTLTLADELAIVRLLRDLHDALFAPIADLLPDRPDQPLLIVPHDTLFRVPFAALAHQPAEGEAVRYLVDDHTIAYAPSLDVLRLLRRAHPPAPPAGEPSLLLVAPTDFGAGVVDTSGLPLRPLRWDPDGVKALADLYPRAVQLPGAKATLAALRAQAADHDVLLLLTHSEAVHDPIRNSYIALTDGLLRLDDTLRLNARLAVLAACGTARGHTTADGVNGFARMMTAAGAGTLMTSLWRVPDDATLELVVDFNRAWRGPGKSLAAALRQAQLERKRIHREVVMWAGFILTGGGL